MIRSEAEYGRVKDRLKEHRVRVRKHRDLLRKEGLDKDAVARAMGPLQALTKELSAEVKRYEQVKRGEFEALTNLQGLGELLVSLRIARGMSQKELAERVGAHVTQVSRDERSGYANANMVRVTRVLEAMEVELVSALEETVTPFEAET